MGKYFNKKRYLLSIFIFIITINIILIFSFISFEENKIRQVKIGIYQKEPKVFINNKGEPSGIWVDIIKEIAKREDWKIEYFISDWQSCLNGLIDGKIDLMLDVAYSEERAKIFDFNKIYVLNSFSKVYANKNINIKNLSDLNGKRIAVLVSSVQEKNLILLKQNLFFNYEIIVAESLKDIFLMTKQGVTDCAITNNFSGDYFYKEYGLKDTNIELFNTELFFITKKNENSELLSAIDKYLSDWKLNKNSIYYKILKKWKVSHKTKIDNLFNFLILILSLIILISIVYIFFTSKRIKNIRTKMKLAYDSLYLSERYFKEFADIAPIGIFKIDNQGNLKFINYLWKHITGFETKDLLGERFFQILDQNNNKFIKESWFNKINKEDEFEETLSVKDINNINHWFKFKIRKIYSMDRSFDGLIGIFDDITNEILLTEKLNERNKDLSILFNFSSAINMNIMESSFTKIILKKLIEFFNLDAIILFILDGEKLILKDMQPDEIRDLWKVEDSRFICEYLYGKIVKIKESIFIDNIEEVESFTREEFIKAGFKSIAILQLKYVDEIIGVLLIASFKISGLPLKIDLLESITQQISISLNNYILHSKLISYSKDLENIVRKRTKELEQALEKAQFADRMKSAFLATMSHELRTPLNSIIGFTGVLLQELPGKLNDEQRKQLSMIKKSSQHLLELINDVLDLSKIEAGELKLSYESIELLPFLEEIINSIINHIQQKGLEFEFSFDNKIMAINSDRRRLKQIIINLLSNAIKFTDSGKISLICKKQENFITFQIIDTGIGIKKEDAKLLFKPFSQINQGLNRNYEGTGLGLSICKKIVELHGGEIQFESEYGIGSKVSFKIPE